MFRFASSDLDFNERQIFYQPFSNSVLRPSSSRFSYEILFHLPFVPNLILRHVISADTLVSDVQSWFAEQINLYNSPSIIDELNQLHFTEGSALYDDTYYGARNFSFNQPIYIISSQSLCQTTSTGYSCIFSGH
jgi:hypothetical protein